MCCLVAMSEKLYIDLSKGLIEEEPLEEKMSLDFILGYGIGVRILWNLPKAGVNALGP